MQFYEIVDRVLSYYPQADTELLEKAYVFAARTYGGKVRSSGEPFLDHPLAVSGLLAHMRLDVDTIAAGMLHDALEENYSDLQEIEEAFGSNVALILQGVTKLGSLEFSSRKERQAEYMRKMILAVSPDIRVILVKLADRLHILAHLSGEISPAQKSMAHETMSVYAPLAARLGIDWIKRELENLSFRFLEPHVFQELVLKLASTEEDRRRYVDEVKQILSAALGEHGITGRITGRPKHLYSIHQKMLRQKVDLTHIYDLIAFRIILDTVKSCYETLGIIHSLWEPVEGRYKDYIVKPKSNMYRSLHTTVTGPYGERMEIQIRTEEMNRVAEEGIAAHWLYKEGKPSGRDQEQETQHFSWLRELLEWNKEWRDPKTFFDSLKLDFFPDEVYVFTPQGEVKAFPRGSTPIDFAYEIHTEIGHRCVGAKVNGKLVPLRTELQNGDTIEILTAPKHRPSKDWLKIVKSTKAINRIRHWFKAEERAQSVALGKEICEREFRKKGLNFNNFINSPELQEVAKSFSLRTVDDLLAGIGYSKLSPLQVIGRLPSMIQAEDTEADIVFPLEKRKSRSTEDGIKVRGADDVMIRMARCCNPLPGEDIIGYITRGRGITVHRLSCRNLGRGDMERKIDVQWDSGAGQVFQVDINVLHSGDRGMLAALNSILGQLDVNVVDLHLDPQGTDMNVCRLRIEVKDTNHLNRVMTALRTEKGVYRVQRSG